MLQTHSLSSELQLSRPCGQRGVSTHLHEGGETLVLLLPGFDELQGEGLVTAESAHCFLDLLLLSTTELENNKPEDLWACGSFITQKRPTTTATRYEQNMSPYPRQQLIPYVVDDRRLVLLAYRCHLICYLPWNFKQQMPWSETWRFIGIKNDWKKTYCATGRFPPGWWICSWCQQGAVYCLGWASGRRHGPGHSACVHGLAPCRRVLRTRQIELLQKQTKTALSMHCAR